MPSVRFTGVRSSYNRATCDQTQRPLAICLYTVICHPPGKMSKKIFNSLFSSSLAHAPGYFFLLYPFSIKASENHMPILKGAGNVFFYFIFLCFSFVWVIFFLCFFIYFFMFFVCFFIYFLGFSFSICSRLVGSCLEVSPIHP